MDTANPVRFRFGPFELDVVREELYLNGKAVSLQSKPFQFLITLLQHQGSIVTREQMSHVLWPDIYVQVNQGLNAAARKVRIALQDEFDKPRYFETLGSHGYRFIHAAEILAWSNTAPETAESLIRVAVLPFETSEERDESWGVGLAGELASMLGRTHRRLKVIAPTSVQGLVEQSGLAAFARQLEVRYALTGRVESDENLSVSVRFEDVEEGRVLWEGNSAAGHVADVLNELASTITLAMQPELLPASAAPPVFPKIRMRTAGQYFAAQQLWFRRTTCNLHQILEAYRKLAEHDPGFSPAHAGTANAWILLAAHDLVAPRPAYQAALAASERALAICADFPEALVAQAWAKLALDHDWVGATRMFEHALQLNSSYAFGYAGYGHLLLARGRVDEAVGAMEQGYKLDPLSASMSANFSMACYYARRYDDAIRLARRALEVDHQNCAASAMLGASYLAQRRYADAVEQFETAVTQANGEQPIMEAHLAHAYAQVGKARNAEPILQRLETRSGQVPTPAYHIALIRLMLGDVNGAVRWLERACQERFQRTLFLGIDPRLDILRGSKHFEEMCKQVREPDPRYAMQMRRREKNGAA